MKKEKRTRKRTKKKKKRREIEGTKVDLNMANS
jgi:hypothetical protein